MFVVVCTADRHSWSFEWKKKNILHQIHNYGNLNNFQTSNEKLEKYMIFVLDIGLRILKTVNLNCLLIQVTVFFLGSLAILFYNTFYHDILLPQNISPLDEDTYKKTVASLWEPVFHETPNFELKISSRNKSSLRKKKNVRIWKFVDRFSGSSTLPY